MPFVHIATDARLHYEDVGGGFPLIALHGRFGTALTDLPQVIDWLGKTYHVYGVSLRGYGESTP
jgi:pimeloyl-ACP methyl ester carboxylesterase